MSETRKLEDLTIHHALKHQPRLTDDELMPWRREMKRKGEPGNRAVLITKDNEIVDGRHWFWCAKKLGWSKVRVEIVPEEEVLSTIFTTLLNRRHYTKGQRAYIVAEHLEEAFQEARRRMIATQNNPAGEAARNSVSSWSRTPEDWAAELGVSVQYLRLARSIHDKYKQLPGKRMFTDDEGQKHECTAREYFEARIMDSENPLGLDPANAGLGFLVKSTQRAEEHGTVHGGGRPPRQEQQLTLFRQIIKSESDRWQYWRKFDEETRNEVFSAVRTQFEKLTPAECEERAEYHEKIAALARKAARAGK